MGNIQADLDSRSPFEFPEAIACRVRLGGSMQSLTTDSKRLSGRCADVQMQMRCAATAQKLHFRGRSLAWEGKSFWTDGCKKLRRRGRESNRGRKENCRIIPKHMRSCGIKPVLGLYLSSRP